MSGNFVQRGDFSVLSKNARAKAAVFHGADLVLELPTPYAVSSAERFSEKAVKSLAATGILTHLSFGCEQDSLDKLERLADALLDDGVMKQIVEETKSGVSFPSARQKVPFKTFRAGCFASRLSKQYPRH